MEEKHKNAQSEENLILQNQLLEKNRELDVLQQLVEMEKGIEIVRNRAISMQNSEDLGSVIEEIYGAFNQLGFQTMACDLIIFDGDSPGYDIWVSGSDGTEGPFRAAKALFDHPHHLGTLEAWKNGESVRISNLSGDQFESYFKIVFDETEGLKFLTEKTKKDVFALGHIMHTEIFTRHGCIRVASLEERTEIELYIQKRFASVLEQTYTRFLDLKTAEAQAREARIEAALERVRSRTIGMQRSDELQEAAALMFQQIESLGVNIMGCGFNIWDDDRKDATAWMSGMKRIQPPFKTSSSKDIFLRIYEAALRGESLFVEEQRGEELVAHYQYMASIPIFRKILENLAVKGLSAPSFQIMHCAFFSQGYLMFITLESASNAYEIFKRFAKVFEQTYTRFLDLQKAEAQAREAQIEAALEKVRSRSLAMHKSEQLPETAKVLFEQFDLLGEAPDRIGICIINEESKEIEFWVTDQIGSQLNHRFKGSLEEATVMAKMFKAWKEGKDSNVLDLSGQDLKDWIKYTRKNVKLPVDDTQIKGRRVHQAAFFSQGMLIFTSNDPVGDDTMRLLVRFAKVFDQAYTRFLDLQKAEAQAREAQIEAALERVRAASMAMHTSEELIDAATVMFEELKNLGMTQSATCAFVLIDEKNKRQTYWGARTDSNLLERLEMPLLGDSVLKERYDAWERKEPVFYQEVGGKNLHDTMEFIWPSATSSEEINRAKLDMPDPTFFYCGNFSHGYLHIIASEQLSEEHESILLRFTIAFEQTYTRFLDLQKAEALAREAQIEAALERVRSQSMAMHNSEELVEVATVLYRELRLLDVREFSDASIVIIDEKNSQQIVWGARTESDFLEKVVLPLLGDQILQRFYDTWRQQEDFFTLKVEGAALHKHLDFVLPKADRTEMEELAIRGMPDPTFFHCAFFSIGYLELMADKELSKDSSSLLIRFAKVFDQAYTRFHDLQKAEAQAREAEIETSLERIRASALAMHKSEELTKVAKVLYKELKLLGITQSATCGFVIVDEKERIQHYYGSPAGKNFLEYFKFPLIGDQVLRNRYEAWKRKDPVFNQGVGGKKLQKHLSVVLPDSEISEAEKNSKLGMPDPTHFYIGNFTYGYLQIIASDNLSKDQIRLLPRFAKVFEQAYTRFLDLQKAEAQAREAQIEAALERVRARAMAMHHSEELAETSTILIEQMESLGLKARRCGFAILREEDKIIEIWSTIRNEKGEAQFMTGHLRVDQHPFFGLVFEAWRNKQSILKEEHHGKDLLHYYKSLGESMEVPEEYMENNHAETISEFYNLYYFEQGFVYAFTGQWLSKDDDYIMERFAQVFDLTYRRFLDLQKAEIRAKEALIEAGLERVRARTMAMHRSEELSDCATVLFKQLTELGGNLWSCGFVILSEDKDEGEFRMTNPKGEIEPPIYISNMGDPATQNMYMAWEEGGDYFSEELSGKPISQHYNNMLALPKSGHVFQAVLDAGIEFPTWQQNHAAYFSNGYLIVITLEPFHASELLKRFAKVFEQTYQRFLDLKKAEAQAREAQIEAALERVRTTSMAMHESQDLHKVIVMVYNQLESLGLKMHSAQISESLEDIKVMHCWIAANGQVYPEQVHIPIIKNIFFTRFKAALDTSESYYTLKLSKRQKDDFFRNYFENSSHQDVAKSRQDFIFSCKGIGLTAAIGKHTALTVMRYDGILYDIEETEIIKRFGQVFDQSYTRFLDLLKAEAQTREAQIEAALERVRAQTMAMHHSADVGVTATTMFDELVNLGVSSRSRCGIGIMDDHRHMELWTASSQADSNVDLNIGDLDMSIHPLLLGAWESWKEGKKLFKYELRGSDLTRYFTVINDAPDYSFQVDLTSLPSKIFHYSFVFSYGILFAFLEEPLPQDIHNIFSRFSHVFNQTYTRYLDLQKAEAQAREAQIEASLERVRAKAMAMHSSNDLLDTTSVLIHELNSLNVHPARLGIAEIIPESKTGRIFSTQVEGQKQDLRLVADITLEGHPVFENILSHWNEEEEYFPVLKGKLMTSYYKELNKYVKVEAPPTGTVQHGLFMFYEKVGIYAWSEEPYYEDVLDVFRRYTTVLGLTYQRYKDLKDAEARAVEAKRDASLDRVRAVIASMRTAEDLKKITPLIWQELTILEVPFFRCGVFIINESTEHIQVFLTTPTGESLAAMNLPFGTSDLLDRTLSHWREQRILKQEWTREEFIEWARSIVEQGYLEDTKSYQGGEAPPEHLALHFVPFTQGMLYVGSEGLLNESQLELVQSLSEAFSVAYARYEDFIKLESTNTALENTVDNLKSTQQQLIQAEKMASLGELTAGIAHEIQNPLNFVNNFSEVNKELIEELEEEIESGNLDEIKTIARDIKENEAKITIHGKRAEGIVKSMLQHSRTSSGEKELTDVNELCDEYLRLAFHGFRAKDKSFQAAFETDLDSDIPKIKVVPQDIGRVLLNLINNAFHAVDEKAKASTDEQYQPTVQVKTELAPLEGGLEGDTVTGRFKEVIITISDNGPGIPDEIKKKIFQPFFTTKPTGEGTGLGLSLSYDIVKAHGGELQVETKEGEGSEFILQIPI